MKLYEVIYTEMDINERVHEIVIGLDNAINYAKNLAKSDLCSFVTLHNTRQCDTNWSKGLIICNDLIYTFDINDEHSVALAKEQNVPCIEV